MKTIFQKFFAVLTILLSLALIAAIVYFVAFIWQPDAIKPALSVVGLERILKQEDTSTPIDLDKAVALFCKKAAGEFEKGSHVIVRKKDIESVNSASKERIHWEIMKNFIERKNINVYGNDNVVARDIKDGGNIFIVGITLKDEHNYRSNYRIFFTMEKMEATAAAKIVLLKDYAVIADENLFKADEDLSSIEEVKNTVENNDSIPANEQ